MKPFSVFILYLTILPDYITDAVAPRKLIKPNKQIRLQRNKNGEVGDPEVSKIQSAVRCFDMAADTILLNAIPFNRAIRRSVFACFEVCLSLAQQPGTPCRGLQYDRNKLTCHFFTLGSATAIRWQAVGYDYFELLPECFAGTTTTSSTTTTTRKPTTTTTPTTATYPPDLGVCSDDMLPLMQKAEGYKFQSSDIMTIPDLSQAECIQGCIEDRDNIGEQYFCYSGSFDRPTRTCTLSVTAPEPSADGGVLLKQAGSVFFEKTCVSKRLAKLCPSLMVERFPQMALIGFQKLGAMAADYETCIELCLDSERKYNFQCKSLMYYHASSNQGDNCLLNYDDHRAEPQLFVTEPSQKVDYVSLTMCQRQISISARNQGEPPILIIREIKTIMSM